LLPPSLVCSNEITHFRVGLGETNFWGKRQILWRGSPSIEIKKNDQSLALKIQGEPLKVGNLKQFWSAKPLLKPGQYQVLKSPFNFQIPHKKQALKIIFLGDSRSKTKKGYWPQITKMAIKYQSHLLVDLGDVVNRGNKIEQWKNWFLNTSKLTQKIPMLVIMGNHDDPWLPAAQKPGNIPSEFFIQPPGLRGSKKETVYIDFGNFSLMGLNFHSLAIKNSQNWISWANKQKQWVQSKMNKPLILGIHYPVHTHFRNLLFKTIPHPADELGQNKFLKDIFKNPKLKWVLQGHNHWYEHFQSQDRKNLSKKSKKNGLTITTTGGAGDRRIPLNFPFSNKILCGYLPGSSPCSGKAHILLAEFHKKKILVKVLEIGSEKQIDSFKIHF